jgi:undecaprenyl-diphosphatase
MNDYLIAVLLGIVEGVTEFLPVSSTAHLRITQSYLGLSLEDEYWKLFAIFIQLGAILSVAVIYRARLFGFLKEALSPAFFRRGIKGMLSHPAGLIGLAFVFTCVPAFVLKKVAGQNLENLGVITAALIVGGIVMIAVDWIFASKGAVKRIEEMKPWQAIWIGLVQTLSAVFPGTSRSMSTIAAGQVAGLNRSTALDFSFLVSIPVMAVATLYDLYKYKKEAAGAVMTAHQAALLAVGFLVSFVVAYAVVAWFLAYVRKRGFVPFGIYRIALGLFLYFSVLTHSGMP